ncbi:hypothetical protein SLE2022_127900 [Rubroshorea leprosula]
MSCLFACFSTSKHERWRRRQLLNATSPNHHRNGANQAIQSAKSLKQYDFQIPIIPLDVSEEKVGERETLNWNSKKKVSFNLNVKTLGELSAGGEVIDILSKKEGENENKKEETYKETKCSVSDLTVSSSVSKPQKNNRYQDCAESDGKYEDLVMEEGLDVDNGGSEARSDKTFIIEESSESLFSLSIESRKQVVEVELDDKEVTSPMQMGKSPSEEPKPVVGLNRDAQDRSQYVDSVLNPVENLAQWKAVKVKASTPLQQEGKENISEEEFEIPFRSKAGRNETMLVDKKIAVDTSLSSWLVGSETTPVSNASSNSVGNSQPKKVNGDRRILGVLAVEELKQNSISVSPKGSKGWSPDETPIIGTIGSYWSHTGQAVISNSRSPSKGTPKLSRNIEDEGVKWNATPFEARFEGALDKIVAAEV